jgi:N-acetylglutamate synthase-like GNAT family acetyltransferase
MGTSGKGVSEKMTVIRKATDRDIPRILELYEQLTEEKLDLSPDIAKRVFSEITALPRQEFLVAEKDGRVAGTLFLQIVPNLSHNARPWAMVENMVVDSQYRRQGIGRELMRYAFSRCRGAGCYKVQLLSNKKRLEAHQFYRSLGFEDSALGFRIYF